MSPLIYSTTQMSPALETCRCKQGDSNIDAQVTVAVSHLPQTLLQLLLSPRGRLVFLMCLSTGLLVSPTLATFGCPRHPLLMSFLMLCLLVKWPGPPSGNQISPAVRVAGGLEDAWGREWPSPSSE